MGKRHASKRNDAHLELVTPSWASPHSDGWANALTGVGTAFYDKRLSSKFRATIIGDEQAEALWESSDLAARCIEAKPETMCREGFELNVADDPENEIAEACEARADEMGMMAAMEEGLKYANAYGGGALWLGADDGEAMDTELNLKRVKSFNWVLPLSKRELTVQSDYADPTHPKYGKPELYSINLARARGRGGVDTGTGPRAGAYAGTGANRFGFDGPLIHESRLIIFQGVTVSRQRTDANGGWGASILARIEEKIRDFDGAFDGVFILLGNAGQRTIKMKGLAAAMGQKKDELVTARARMVEQSRSICRAVLLDSEEEILTEPFQGAGIDTILDKFMLRLAAAARMPVSVLFGQAPAGLNATGDSDMRWWYDTVRADQGKRLRPAINRFMQVMFAAKDGPTSGTEPDNWTVSFPSLYQLSEGEKADVRLKHATADNLYISNTTLDPREVAVSRFGGDEYGGDIKLDFAGRAEFEATQTKITSADPNAPAGPAGIRTAALPGAVPRPSLETGGSTRPIQGKT